MFLPLKVSDVIIITRTPDIACSARDVIDVKYLSMGLST